MCACVWVTCACTYSPAAFYSVFDGLHVTWEVAMGDTPSPLGVLHLNPLAEVVPVPPPPPACPAWVTSDCRASLLEAFSSRAVRACGRAGVQLVCRGSGAVVCSGGWGGQVCPPCGPTCFGSALEPCRRVRGQGIEHHPTLTRSVCLCACVPCSF